ncbi:MAG: type II secretion system protein [Verrucomicrobiae bacterium]|nr:type II secretion system protein [Verrucomicrobiae bacterium]
MKTRSNQNNLLRRAFTLMELLVVITLIAVLAAMVLAGAGGILKKIKRDQIRNYLAEIDAGLEAYRVDNGIYPLNPDPIDSSGTTSIPGYNGQDGEAVAGAAVLYKHLSGDFDTDGLVDEKETVYVDRLDYWSNSDKNGKAPEVVRSVSMGGSVYLVVDPLGSPVRYLADPPGYTPEQRKTRNPTFDLWSIAGAEPDSEEFSDQSTWITNWGSQ